MDLLAAMALPQKNGDVLRLDRLHAPGQAHLVAHLAVLAVDGHRITNLMIERVDLVDGDEGQGIRIAWRELGWRALIAEFAGGTIGAEMVEIE